MPDINDGDWVQYLQQHEVIENEEEGIKRKQVLQLLHNLIASFQRKVQRNNDYKRGEIECLLSPFGSYALGGYTKGADIDLVLICPWIVKRNDFFKIVPELLKFQPTVRDVEIIKKTAVPIIKCVIDSISIDISFVRLRGERLKDNLDLLDDTLLNRIDPVCLASMDGPRVNKFIKEQIRREHVYIFQKSLQCIKHWATVRDIYSKPAGYLNGSSWTLLLLKTYMIESVKFKDLSITHLLYSFFETWATWPWQTPVLFTDFIPGENGTRVSYNELTCFNNATMPIVSPCYPVSSVAPFVTKSTLKIMTREFQRAQVILNTNTNKQSIMGKLFNPLNYFKRYDNFICITTTSTTFKSHDIWTRKMQYSLPQFLSFIETCPRVKQIQGMVDPTIVISQYRTTQEYLALKNGASLTEAKEMGAMGDLNPGAINIIYQFIGVQLIEPGKIYPLSKRTYENNNQIL
ncbi:hypothetical protein INT47_006136 [Mucor saturninus]|uniref:polynucleotide adenylyltransferase n=1 Tax=Mucor saturninus TaxID=64648 RepID=A0A8H7V5U0_9FUNG|nr:hypothetical protein INT47_006136 [Mucor saturninus]